MSVRWRWPGAASGSRDRWRGRQRDRRVRRLPRAMAIALVAASFNAMPARAQTLNIGPAEVPASAGAAAATAREELQAELDWLQRELEQGASRRIEAQIAVRRYALSMLPGAGQDERLPPTSLQLVGRTLWRLAPAIDRAIEQSEQSAAGHIVLLLSRAPVPLDASAAELALRDALAPIASAGEAAEGDVGGWIDARPEARPGGQLATPLDANALLEMEDMGADPATLEQISQLESLLQEADQWRAYRRSAARIRSLLRLGARALLRRGRVDDITAAAMIDAWADAARHLAEEGGDAALQVELLHGLVSAMELLDIAAGLEGRRWDRTRAAAMAAMAHDPTMRSGQLRANGRMLTRVARLVTSGAGETATERDVVRQVRPAWRFMARTHEQAVEDLAAVAPELLSAGRAVTDPGALAAVAALEEQAADLRGLLLISAVITDPETPESREPRVAPQHRLVAARLLRHGQALQSGDGAEAALRELREFAALLRARDGGPSADWLARQPAHIQQAWTAMAGGRALELLQTDADLIDTWLHIWGDTNDATRLRDLQQRLRAHELLLPLLRDLGEAAAIAASDQRSGEVDELSEPAPGRAARWPGWELSTAAMDALLARADARLADAIAFALDRRGAAPADRAAALTEDLAPLRLLVYLERTLAGADAPDGGTLDEITLGPPLPGALLAQQRETIAAAALAIEDWALAPEADDELWPRAVGASARALREVAAHGR